MAYSKQNFQDGQILTAANLEKMENGIIAGQGVRNLLVNSDFRNPIDINGQIGVINAGEPLNKWIFERASSDTATIVNKFDNYIQIYKNLGQARFYQLVDYNLLNKTVTYAIGTSEGIYVGSCVVSADSQFIQIGTHTGYLSVYQSILSQPAVFSIFFNDNSEDSIFLYWAALYEGAYDASTLPPYVPKGKHVEMLNCRVPLAPYNLLDNSDFRNPVNQRGKTSYGGGEYAIDRWKMQSGTNINIMDGFIRITGDWDAQQILGNKLIGTYTYAIYAKVNVAGEYTQTIEIYENGSSIATSFCTVVGKWKIYTCTATFTGANNITNPVVTINNRAGSISDASMDVQWAALYEGSYDASTLPPYVPKGKHVEMLNCGVQLNPRNLLDNSDFRNPVNQRGKTSYSALGYTIDRWRTWDDGAVTINNGYISHETPIYQAIAVKLDTSKAYTLAVMNTDNVVTLVSGFINNDLWGIGINIAYNNGDSYVRIYADDHVKNIVWAALYEGSYTVETLPAYVPKGYAAELAECQRYYRTMPNPVIPCGNNPAGTQVYGFMTFRMRIANPTVSCDQLYFFKGDSTYCSVSSASAESYGSGTRIVFNLSQSVGGNLAGAVAGYGITISADL